MSSYPTGLDSLATNKVDGLDAGDATPGSVIVGDHATHHNTLADAVNKIEAELGVNPSGSAATVAAAIAGLTSSPAYQLATNVSVGATTITLDRNAALPIVVGSVLLLSAYTTRAELKAVTAIAGSTITVTATKTAHTAGDNVLVISGGKDGVTFQMYGGLGNGTDEWAPIQRMLIEATSIGLSVEGFNATFYTQQPLITTGGARVNTIAFQSRTGFAPVDAAGAMLMHGGAAALSFTAVASTNLFTVTGGHGLTAYDTTNDTKIVFNNPYGETLPGGITSGKVYYIDTIPDSTTFTVSATAGGATLDITVDGGGMMFRAIQQLSRLFSESLRLNVTVALLNGMLASLQQPSWVRNLRIEMDASASTGAVGLQLAGQLSYLDNVEINGPGDQSSDGAYITGTGHVIRGFNGQGSNICMRIVTADAITVETPWTESPLTAGIQIEGVSRGISIVGTWLHSALTTVPALKVTATTTSYEIGLIRSSAAGQLLVNDTGRSISLSLPDDGDAGQVFGGLRQFYGVGFAPILKDRVTVGKTANYTVRYVDETVSVDTTGATRTMTLPTAVGWQGHRVTIGNWAGANTVIIDGAGAELIDGVATLTLTAGQAAMLLSTGVGWVTLAAVS